MASPTRADANLKRTMLTLQMTPLDDAESRRQPRLNGAVVHCSIGLRDHTATSACAFGRRHSGEMN